MKDDTCRCYAHHPKDAAPFVLMHCKCYYAIGGSCCGCGAGSAKNDECRCYDLVDAAGAPWQAHCNCYHGPDGVCCVCGTGHAGKVMAKLEELHRATPAPTLHWVMRYGDRFVQDPFRIDMTKTRVRPAHVDNIRNWHWWPGPVW